jgi:hypothetical protein
MKLVAYSEGACGWNLHRYRLVDKKDSVRYFECQRCGTRRAVGLRDNIRVNWVMGKVNRILTISSKKEK